MREVGAPCVNVLADDQHRLCTLLAVSGADKFDGCGRFA
jgi:hypothetical protein